MGKSNPTSKYVDLDGIRFYKERTGQGYYLGNVPDENGKRHPKRLHVYVWEREYGKIDKGWHIHHIDGNVDNNDLSNLQCIHSFSHGHLHMMNRAEWSRQNLDEKARPKAVEWHKSSQGSAVHKLTYEQVTRDIWLAPVTKVCEICGKEYTTTHAKASTSRFCSNNCRAKFRRMSGVDNETRHCVICGSEFTCNKYSKQKCCSNKECSNESQRRIKTGVPRPQK